ncbi:amino acid ABC transporter ATP-binding protein [Cryobacterium frigoriphilum]|uniref:Amino acid ABC transporter ATP-binding protein n=1 Tax=Cryobacterium frigoriphilum TaxID=1259150 RepID=A0A4R8ZV46_9MICO|nr:amino acid ABC transporter ATP-binding protein [Cryobacterium frigoriphilum]TFD46903.1 amino acid ABC transporter ATP-binding protein [Cryobacterium frigoriphilum]
MSEMLKTPVVSLKGVIKKYGSVVAVNGVDLEVFESQTVAIIGPSGSGKSTVIRTINGLESHDGGEIVVNGVTLDGSKSSIRDVRNDVGMVFQQFNLFPYMSALDNITLAPRRRQGVSRLDAEAHGMELLEKVGLKGFESRYPSELSGGQQQRVAIARGLATKPKVMLFDEPTSALDPEVVQDVLGVMKDLAHDGVTMIVVTHELTFAAQVANSIVFMDAGVVVEQGDGDSLLRNPQHKRTIRFLSSLNASSFD